MIYLSEWGLSRVQRTTPALDNPQADRYYPDSRMTLSIIKNIERKEVNTFMELKHVIPNMERTFGNLEFAGENKVEQRRINGRMTVVSRSFNLYSDVQRADDIIVVLPASAGEKNFESEEKVKLINPKITCRILFVAFSQFHLEFFQFLLHFVPPDRLYGFLLNHIPV